MRPGLGFRCGKFDRILEWAHCMAPLFLRHFCNDAVQQQLASATSYTATSYTASV